jgi:hypothetical protein
MGLGRAKGKARKKWPLFYLGGRLLGLLAPHLPDSRRKELEMLCQCLPFAADRCVCGTVTRSPMFVALAHKAA